MLRGRLCRILGAAKVSRECLNRVDQQGRKTQSQREVGVGVLTIAPGSVAISGSNWEQGYKSDGGFRHKLGARLIFKKAVDTREQKLRDRLFEGL